MSDFNSADVTTAVGPIAPETLSEDPEPFADEQPETEDGSDLDLQPREREGLPSSYRMRAEDHYVDELNRRGAIERTPAGPGDGERGRDGAWSHVHDGDEHVLEQLSSEIESIESAAALLTERSSALSRQVAADLIRSQARRAGWLLAARTLTAGGGDLHARPTAIGTLLGRVRDGLAAECRLAGVTLQFQTPDWQALVAVDGDSFVTGLTGAILATLGLSGPSHGGIIRVTAVTLGGDLRTVEVHQDAAVVPGAARRRFFDPAWTDRPGGVLSALGAVASRAAARQHGGDALFMVRERRGSTLRMNFGRRS